MTRLQHSLLVLAALAMLTLHTHSQDLFTTTAYCLTGLTRTGTYTSLGTVAVDPDVIPLGSLLRIEGFDITFAAEDTGGGVHGRHVDIWFASCEQAINYGRQQRAVYILY